MSFNLVYYSQQDPQWKNDILGFGDATDTIGYVGCALTSVAMLLSGFGYTETPKSLNQKLKNVNGFAGAGIRWGSVSQLYPQVTLKAFIPCTDSAAPLAQIDASIASGQPVIVMVDNSPVAGLQTHWVALYQKITNDYLMLDPWPYQTDVTKPTPLMPRYSQGRPLQRSIMHVILYECLASGGVTPGPAPTPGGPSARVKADVVWGLNIRSSINTSSMANVIATVPAGTQLTITEPGGETRIGAVNQWVRVRDSQGHEGFAAAWYLEKVDSPSSTPPAPTPVDPTARLKVVVSASAGASGLKVFARASTSSKVVSTQSVGSVLACLDPQDVARSKVGVKGQWLYIRYDVAKKGYVQAEFVETLS